ncbi:MAG TPA: septum formation initiator family protein [Bryobacteraceae bacterium]|jgi:hypothetical protein|nr:septum formation initiator family protein [Bryobacteraceae bacterium]
MNTAFRRLTYVIAFVIVGAYIVIALRGPQGIPALLEKRRQIRTMEEQNANLMRQLQQQRDRIRKLSVSKAEQEEQIRKDYHLQRRDDVTLMLPGQQPSNKDGAASPSAPASDTQGQ